MKFNPNQSDTRCSIRRLNGGVASVVVASAFFVLVDQPSSVRADVLTDTPAQLAPQPSAVSEKTDLPTETSTEPVDTGLPID